MQSSEENQEESNYDLTVSTDLTVSFISDGDKGESKHDTFSNFKLPRDFNREFLVLKKQLSYKDSVIKRLQNDLMTVSKQYEEKIHDIMNSERMQRIHIQSQLNIHELDVHHKITLLQKQVEHFEEKAKASRIKCSNLEEDIKNLKSVLESISFSQAHYSWLKSQPKALLKLTDYVLLKFYEHMAKCVSKNEELAQKNENLQLQLEAVEEKCSSLIMELEGEKRKQTSVKSADVHLINVKQAESSTTLENHKENLNKLKFEKVMLQKEMLAAKDEISELKHHSSNLIEENELTKTECIKLKQNQALLQKESEYLDKDIRKLTDYLEEARDKIQQQQLEIDHAKSSQKKELEQYMNSREKMLKTFEQKYKEAQNELRESMEKIHSKEIRMLNETTNALMKEKMLKEEAYSELKFKYDHLFQKISSKKEYEDQQFRILEKEIKNLNLENQNLKDNLLELKEALHKAYSERDEMVAKLKKIQEEYGFIKQKFYKEFSKEKQNQLRTGEPELKETEVVNSVKRDGNPMSREVTKFSAEKPHNEFIFEENLDECVSLFIRIEKLETYINEIETKLNSEIGANAELHKKLQCANAMLKQVGQPEQYFISTLKSKDDQIHALSRQVLDLIKKLGHITEAKKKVISENEELKRDLKKILEHREELTKSVKDLISSFQKQNSVAK